MIDEQDKRLRYWQNLYYKLADRFDKQDVVMTKQAARIKKLEDALGEIRDYWDGYEGGIESACKHNIKIARVVLDGK